LEEGHYNLDEQLHEAEEAPDFVHPVKQPVYTALDQLLGMAYFECYLKKSSCSNMS